VQSSSKRICMLISGLNKGGAEKQLVQLAVGLKETGWKVMLVSIIPPIEFLTELSDAGVDVISLDIPRGMPDLRMFFRMIKLLKSFQPHILLCFMFHAILLGRITGRLTGVPRIICSIRGERYGEKYWGVGRVRTKARELIVGLTDHLSDMCVVPSHSLAEIVVAQRMVKKSRLTVIPNGIRIEKYDRKANAKRALHNQLKIEENDFVWLNVTRLEPKKDHNTLLHSFKQHLSVASNARLLIAGEGPLRNELENTADKLGLENKVKFLGKRDDIPELLCTADAFVLSSTSEGFPNVLLEAHAASLPVAATNAEGVSEIVLHGESGLIVEKSNIKLLAEVMNQIWNMPERARLKFGMTGYQLVKSKFDAQNIIQQWERLFLNL